MLSVRQHSKIRIDWLIVAVLVAIAGYLIFSQVRETRNVYQEWGDPHVLRNGLAKPVQDFINASPDGGTVKWCGPVKPYGPSGKRWEQNIRCEAVNKFGVRHDYDMVYIFSRTNVYYAWEKSYYERVKLMPINPGMELPPRR